MVFTVMAEQQSEQVGRIAAYEQRLDRVQTALEALVQAWENYLAVKDDFDQLDAYLGSPEWHADREADAASLLPPSLRRGVLSEDAVWNLLQARRELLEDIRDGMSLGEEKC